MDGDLTGVFSQNRFDTSVAGVTIGDFSLM
jgi:hypothetical protein